MRSRRTKTAAQHVHLMQAHQAWHPALDCVCFDFHCQHRVSGLCGPPVCPCSGSRCPGYQVRLTTERCCACCVCLALQDCSSPVDVIPMCLQPLQCHWILHLDWPVFCDGDPLRPGDNQHGLCAVMPWNDLMQAATDLRACAAPLLSALHPAAHRPLRAVWRWCLWPCTTCAPDI